MKEEVYMVLDFNKYNSLGSNLSGGALVDTNDISFTTSKIKVHEVLEMKNENIRVFKLSTLSELISIDVTYTEQVKGND